METLEQLFEKQRIFALRRFPNITAEACLKHLEREINEVRKETDRDKLGIEYVDCFMLLLDSLYRAGFSIDELKMYFKQKQAINDLRDWNKNSDGPILI